jgi:glucosylceramidase
MRMNVRHVVCFLILTAFAFTSCSVGSDEGLASDDHEVSRWMTTGNRTSLLEKQPGMSFVAQSTFETIIDVDTSERFQAIDGFGYSLTGGSADLINTKLGATEKANLLRELFLRDDNGIGVSYLRISIGASDLDDHVFSYCDLPDGQTDPELNNFSLDEDRENLIPVLRQILALNPDIRIMGSPWSAPAWMKTNNKVKGGSLKPEFYPAYAKYFVKYVKGMESEGIRIDAITIQNEPENPHNTPSMLMTWEEQADFVKNHLGPAFEEAGIDTKIVLFDHNCDNPDYPISIMNDPDAKKYVDGSAFHLYLGEIEAMSKVHQAHPDKNLYFTEQWTSGEGQFDGDLRWHVKHLIVGATRNWSRTVLEWNLASDPNFDPHTDDGGCTQCMGAVTIGDNTITRNVAYYIIAHASKFVPPGSVRVASTVVDGLYNVAFLTPDDKKVLIVVNDNDSSKKFAIRHKGRFVETALASGAVGTYVW